MFDLQDVKRAIDNRDFRTLGRIVEHLRHGRRLNYDAIYRTVNAIRPVEPAAWDQLLYDLDESDWDVK
jgi:hypothetical protein